MILLRKCQLSTDWKVRLSEIVDYFSIAARFISVLDVHVQLHLYRARCVATWAKVIRLVKMIEFINDLFYTSNGKCNIAN